MLSILLLAAAAGGPRVLTQADFRGSTLDMDQGIISMAGPSYGRTGNLPERFTVTCDAVAGGRVANCEAADGSTEGQYYANMFTRRARLKPEITGRVRYTSNKIRY